MDVFEGKLQLFELFRHDTTLPKWKEKHKQTDIIVSNTVTLNDSPFRSMGMPESSMVIRSNSRWVSNSWLNRLITWLLEKFGRVTRREMTVQQLFSSVKDTVEQIVLVNERAAGYEALLAQAKLTGQTALHEQLVANLEAVRSETQLIAMGLTKTISEERLVELNKKSPRGIRIDWIDNFTRPIPADVIEKKRECDVRCIFDNYVVMHYDPKKKNAEPTQKQKIAMKDPILFGVIEGRRKLYFVGDWIDEHCDLTLDKVAELLGRGTVRVLDRAVLVPEAK